MQCLAWERLIRPLQIVDDEERGPVPGESLQELLQRARGRALALLDGRVRKAAPGGAGEEDELTDDAQICSCNNVDLGTIKKAIADGKLNSVPGVMGATKAGKGCGGCIPAVTDILKKEMLKAGATVTNYLCPHFDFSRAELCQVRISHSFP